MWSIPFADEPAPPALEDPTAPERDDDVGDLVITLLPWLISILLHVGIVLLAVFVVWSTVTEIDEEEIIVPEATLSETPGAPLTQQQETESESESQAQATATASRRSAQSASNAQSQSLSASESQSDSALIGIAGGGGGGAGKASPFGSAGGGGAGFKASFFGTGGNARQLVYLVDASGSLIDTFPFVIRELKRSIGELKDEQRFSVLFFQGDDYIETPPPGPQNATGEYKQRVNKWLDPEEGGNVAPLGPSNPVGALRRSLQWSPQLMFLLSDNVTGQGRYEVDQRRLIQEIMDANRAGTKINTIQFVYDDPLVKYGLPRTLERISELTGGVHRFVTAQELGLYEQVQ